MKNYPNQASSFERVRGTLATVRDVVASGRDPLDDGVLGYEAARNGVYTFRGLDPDPAQADLEARIALEREKPSGSQGARTFARELRRTLSDLGWLDEDALLTTSGEELLTTGDGSIEEQVLLVEGLLRITVASRDTPDEIHHPVHTLLRLLAHRPSHSRVGLELALEPRDDSEEELNRVLALYDLTEEDRAAALGVSQHQRANAVKIFPTLARYAGLVVEDEDRTYALSQDGWQAIGQEPADAGRDIARNRGRRTTVGRLVSPSTIATSRTNRALPRVLSPDEQQMAAGRLLTRTNEHQLLVSRMAQHLPADGGQLFEDEFSYDMLWIPNDADSAICLFEMKTVTGDVDAYARARDALGQLKYYAYFKVGAPAESRGVELYFVANERIPDAICDFFTTENVGVIVARTGEPAFSLNLNGERFLDRLRSM